VQDGVGVAAVGSKVGEAVGGTGVGSVKPCFVGGKVDVTTMIGAFGSVVPDVFTHAVNRKRRDRASIIF